MNIYDLRDKCRQNFNKYLRQIISLISDMKGKQFLDIGCGTGVSACFIAQTFDYFITALDINESSLKVLRKKIKYLGLEDKIKVLKGSFEMLGKNEVMFDTILAEGLFNVIGFETGIKKPVKSLNMEAF
jgi:arsenite methyltransferase